MSKVEKLSLRKVVIPAAGMGTRFLPATKAMPKEMLPVVDKPAIQYVVEEATAAGLHEIIMITGRNKRALEDHFDRATELETLLEEKGNFALLDSVRESTELAHMHYVRQAQPRGLGDAVLTAEIFVGDEPFVVLLGDDLIDERDPILPTMIKVYEEFGGCVLALMEVSPEEISQYGVAAVVPIDPSFGFDGVVRITGLVEKPTLEDAPSNYAVLGRYLLTPEIFPILRVTKPGRGNEVQLTDAIQVLTQRGDNGGPVHGVIFKGRRYDTGDKLGYLQATVRLAAERADLGPKFSAWLKDFVKGL
ncbi:MAG TPA: UTP--glucose-1-phosphate uridylyltransferase GalU [Candidatus Paceibacterota bacterium]|nr:UTP--glucose-1-phosphate uridylyltransferase GalU [Candidatus Paceibacterota bacterium]